MNFLAQAQRARRVTPIGEIVADQVIDAILRGCDLPLPHLEKLCASDLRRALKKRRYEKSTASKSRRTVLRSEVRVLRVALFSVLLQQANQGEPHETSKTDL